MFVVRALQFYTTMYGPKISRSVLTKNIK